MARPRHRKNSPLTSKPFPFVWDTLPSNPRGDHGYWTAEWDWTHKSPKGQTWRKYGEAVVNLYTVPGNAHRGEERAAEVAFDIDGHHRRMGDSDTRTTARIFATAIKVVEEYIEHSPWQISTVFFTASLDEPTRVKMYDTMARLLAKRLSKGHGVPVYLARQDEASGSADNRKYVITTRNPEALRGQGFYVMSEDRPMKKHRWNPR